jgi:hypothetical protein
MSRQRYINKRAEQFNLKLKFLVEQFSDQMTSLPSEIRTEPMSVDEEILLERLYNEWRGFIHKFIKNSKENITDYRHFYLRKLKTFCASVLLSEYYGIEVEADVLQNYFSHHINQIAINYIKTL